MKTKVVNLYAGPGAGKTTSAWEIAARLKKEDVNTEYVPEYAKELVWENQLWLLDGSEKNQMSLLQEQIHRQERLLGKVEVIVTDSPLLLGLVYAKEKTPILEQMALEAYAKYDNLNLFVKREKKYQQAGRIQTLEQSLELDGRIRDMLKEYGIICTECSRANIGDIVKGIKRELESSRDRKKGKRQDSRLCR